MSIFLLQEVSDGKNRDEAVNLGELYITQMYQNVYEEVPEWLINDAENCFKTAYTDKNPLSITNPKGVG